MIASVGISTLGVGGGGGGGGGEGKGARIVLVN